MLLGCRKQGRDLVPESIELKLANRHGLITGATGTGKTVTLQILAKGSQQPASPCSRPTSKVTSRASRWRARSCPHLVKRANEIGLGERFGNSAFPTAFWDVSVSRPSRPRHRAGDGAASTGPSSELTEPQEGVLNIAFRWAEDERANGDAKMAILDCRTCAPSSTRWASAPPSCAPSTATSSTANGGRAATAPAGARTAGAANFFGEPALDIDDFIKTSADGRA